MDAYLVYDAGCRLCTVAKGLVKAFDWREAIHPVALQDPLAARMLAAMDEGRRRGTFHVVTDGRVASGGEGLLDVLGIIVTGRAVPCLAARVPALLRASDRAYGVLHAVRDALHCAT